MRQHRETVPEPPAPAPGELPVTPLEGELDGMEEFGNVRNWVSFDAQRGKLTCRSQQAEYDAFQAVILESRVVRVMKDEDGSVLCSSSDRVTADNGRPGRDCGTCEDRDQHCFPRWQLNWQDIDTGLVFAHTLSQTGSLNFFAYAAALKRDGLAPSQVVTRIFVEEAHRQKTNSLYRRLQFERQDAVAAAAA